MIELYPRLAVRRTLLCAGVSAALALALIPDGGPPSPTDDVPHHPTRCAPPEMPVVKEAPPVAPLPTKLTLTERTKVITPKRPKQRKAKSADGRAVQDVILAHRKPLEACYAAARTRDAAIQGEVKLRWTVGFAGKVTDAEVVRSTLDDSAAERCLMDVVLGMSFAGLAGRGGLAGVRVSHLFVMRPKAPSQVATVAVEGLRVVSGDINALPVLGQRIEARLDRVLRCYTRRIVQKTGLKAGRKRMKAEHAGLNGELGLDVVMRGEHLSLVRTGDGKSSARISQPFDRRLISCVESVFDDPMPAQLTMPEATASLPITFAVQEEARR